MPAQGPTIDTYGLMIPSIGRRVNLRGLPAGHPAEANPDNVVTLPVSAEYGAAGVPLAMPAHEYAEAVISLSLEEVPAWQFEDLRDLVDDGQGRAVKFSPIGSTTYLDGDWLLVSTTAGWVETRRGVWAGPLELWRRGDP